MRKQMLNILLATILPFFSQCKKENPVPPSNIEPSPVVWMFHTETNAGLAMKNYIYKNMIIQGHAPGSGVHNPTKIWALTLDSGKVVWQTQIPITIPTVYEGVTSKNNYLFAAGDNNLYAINMDNGETVWSYTDPIAQSSVGLSIIGNHVYFSISGNRIIQFDIQTGTPKTILTLNKDDLDNFSPGISTPSYWKHPSGDDILIMGNWGNNGQATT
jgi:outer membrane protein assembly factor BamB